MKRRIFHKPAVLSVLLLCALLLILGAAGCSAGEKVTSVSEIPTSLPAGTGDADAGQTDPAAGAADGVVSIDLNSGTAAPDQAVWTSEQELRIAAPGTYELSGALEGRVTVDADGPVTLLLNGVSLIGESCLDIQSGDLVILAAAEGTVNTLTDTAPSPASGEASSGEPSSGEPAAEGAEESVSDGEAEETEEAASDASGAVITAKVPLLLSGEGRIDVTAAVNNGIRCKDSLTLESGVVTVSAANNGIKVRGDLTVTGGELAVTAQGDGLAAEAARISPGGVSVTGGSVTVCAGARGIDAEGSAALSGGRLSITAENDGIRADSISMTGGALTVDAQCDGLQAETLLSITGGTAGITTGGGGGDAISHAGESFGPWAQSAAEDDASAKGLKSTGDITIAGGVIDLSTADDSIHCAQVFTMDGGDVTIVSSDDAIHADDMLVINAGSVRVDDCFEGLEAFAVELRGGDVIIRAVNDGINANGSEMMFGRGSSEAGETESTSVSGAATTYVLISGGTLDLAVTGSMSNMGDGIDSNGAVYITGGTSVISTYGTFMENGLDTGWGGPVVTGGAVLAGGSSTMTESFSSSSTQCCAVVATSYMPDGTQVTLTDEDGSEIWSVTMADAFSCLQISHPALEPGHIYTLTYGGQSTTLDFTATTNIENNQGFGFGGRPF